MDAGSALPDLDTDEALAAWLSAARSAGDAELDRVLEPLTAALELDPPAPALERARWRTRIQTALGALAPHARDPRVARAVLAAIGSSSSDDWFYEDEATHVFGRPAPAQDPATR